MSNFGFSRLFSNNSNRNVHRNRSGSKGKRGRTCRIEELEGREKLDAGLFSAIKDAYTDLDLGDDWERYNFIEIAADNISEAALRNAISQVGTTTQDDIIVVHTTATQNRITLGGSAVAFIYQCRSVWECYRCQSGDKSAYAGCESASGVMSVGTPSSVIAAGLTITGGGYHGYNKQRRWNLELGDTLNNGQHDRGKCERMVWRRDLQYRYTHNNEQHDRRKCDSTVWWQDLQRWGTLNNG